jgi:hypothetical protein
VAANSPARNAAMALAGRLFRVPAEHMVMGRLFFIAIISMVLPLAACAGPSRSTPPEAERVHPPWLVGTWQGTAFQVAASKGKAQEVDVTVTFAEGGAWKAMTGASGTSWLAGNLVVLDGVSANGGWIRYTLKERRDPGGTHELWGIADANFGAAAVSLKRIR